MIFLNKNPDALFPLLAMDDPVLYHPAMALGTHIQAWRLSKQLSIEALAAQAGLDATTLEAIEADLADPNTGTLESLAAALAIPPSWLFDLPKSFAHLFDETDTDDQPSSGEVDPVTSRILGGSRMDRSLYVLLTALIQAGDPKLLRAAEVSLRSLVKQSRQAAAPWLQRPSGHFEPPSD